MDFSNVKKGEFTNNQLFKLITTAGTKNKIQLLMLLDFSLLGITEKLNILKKYQDRDYCQVTKEVVDQIDWRPVITEVFQFFKEHGVFSRDVSDSVLKVLDTGERITLLEIAVETKTFDNVEGIDLDKFVSIDMGREYLIRLYKIFLVKCRKYGGGVGIMSDIIKSGVLSKKQLLEILKRNSDFAGNIINTGKFSDLEMLDIVIKYIDSSSHGVGSSLIVGVMEQIKKQKNKKETKNKKKKSPCVHSAS